MIKKKDKVGREKECRVNRSREQDRVWGREGKGERERERGKGRGRCIDRDRACVHMRGESE